MSEEVMGFIKQVLSLLFLLQCCFSFSSNIEHLTYFSEQHPPFNYLDQSGTPQGYAYELLQEIWYELEVPQQPVSILPWVKAYSNVQKNKHTVLFSASKISSREKDFKWVCSIIDINVVLLGLKEKNINVNSMAHARGFKVVAIRSAEGERLLIENHFNEKRIFQVNEMKTALKVVLLGGVDFIATNELDAYRALRELGQDPDEFKVNWILKSTPICYAFNRNVSNRIIKHFQQALDEVQKNTTFIDQLKHKYDLSNH